MKKQTFITVFLSLFLMIGMSNTAEAQLGNRLKKAAASKVKSMKKGEKSSSSTKSSSKKNKSSFSEFNNEADEMGVTGEYFDLNDNDAMGLRFVKEAEGKIVNKLHIFEKKGDEPQAKMNFVENYYEKYQIKMFFVWLSTGASSYFELMELAPGVFAQIGSDRTINSYDEAVAVDALRKVKNVIAKNTADFDTWDIETAQAKVDMNMVTLKSANSDKVKKKLLKFEAYKSYVGKIAFAKGTNYLKNIRSNQPTEKVSNFITKRELGATTAYKPYFDQPIEISHPGAWFNVTYEMLGKKTDREELRKKSTKYSKNIPQYDKGKNEYYFTYSKVLLDQSNNRADYAFLELLRQTQDQLLVGQTYDLKLTIWAHKDGVNIDPIATGTIQFEYTPGENGTKKLLFDPIKGWVTILEDYLDE